MVGCRSNCARASRWDQTTWTTRSRPTLKRTPRCTGLRDTTTMRSSRLQARVSTTQPKPVFLSTRPSPALGAAAASPVQLTCGDSISLTQATRGKGVTPWVESPGGPPVGSSTGRGWQFGWPSREKTIGD